MKNNSQHITGLLSPSVDPGFDWLGGPASALALVSLRISSVRENIPMPLLRAATPSPTAGTLYAMHKNMAGIYCIKNYTQYDLTKEQWHF
jgi:hypothetical protein